MRHCGKSRLCARERLTGKPSAVFSARAWIPLTALRPWSSVGPIIATLAGAGGRIDFIGGPLLPKASPRRVDGRRMQKTIEKRSEGTTANPADNRKSHRDSLVAPATLSCLQPDSDEPSRRVWVYNISLGGIAFRIRRPLDAGGMYRLKLVAGPLYLESEIRIVWCRRRDDQMFEVGAQFHGK